MGVTMTRRNAAASRREAQRRQYAERRAAWLAEHGPCARCGSSKSLEVDHVDPATKVSHRIWSWSDTRRAAELAKCQVLCTPCHHEKTAAELARPVVHGTHVGYAHHGCRCAPCTAAHRAYCAPFERPRRPRARRLLSGRTLGQDAALRRRWQQCERPDGR